MVVHVLLRKETHRSVIELLAIKRKLLASPWIANKAEAMRFEGLGLLSANIVARLCLLYEDAIHPGQEHGSAD